MKTNLIFITGILSLIVQVVTGVFDFYVLKLNIPNTLSLLRNLLILEFVVQIIEGSFYVWMISNFAHIPNITSARYYDWVITTPTMLFTFCFYLLYLKSVEDNKPIGYGTGKNSFNTLVYNNLPNLIPIFILNWIMLGFGYLGEIGKINHTNATLMGFIPFFMCFYMIYIHYANKTWIGTQVFFWFFGIWSLYGVASLMSYKVKNMMYNILDLFAKNFFGIYLAVVLFNQTL